MKDEELLEELLQSVSKGKLAQGTLSSPFDKKSVRAVKIDVRPLMIKDVFAYQVSEHIAGKVFHTNYAPDQCAEYLKGMIRQYRQGIFSTEEWYYHVLLGKNLSLKVVRKGSAGGTIPLVHNRKKNHVLQEGVPVPFLIALGIMNESGGIYPKKYDKFRQINRFCEMVRDISDQLPGDRCLEIVDFGCGKAYLTFALHYYLQHLENREVRILGLDLKKDVIENCESLAKRLGLKGLSFAVADINDFDRAGKVDLVIALHACDTATDAAIEKAVRWGAEVILCVPCCQHELYSQIESKELDTLLRHGILRERFAALATDAARAEFLAMLGYDVQVLEFIDTEHTPKNLLIRAVKGSSEVKKAHASGRYRLFKQALSITPSIEKRFPDVFTR